MAVLIYLLITLSKKLCIWAKGTTKTLLKCHCLFQEVRRSCIVSWWRHFLLTWKTLRVFILAVDKNFYLFRFWHRLSKSPSSDFLWPLARDFVARSRLLRGQRWLAPLTKRSTCSKSSSGSASIFLYYKNHSWIQSL